MSKNSEKKAYLVGGGIGSLAAAAFMIRDGGMAGRNITIYEALRVVVGSMDAAGDPKQGYSMRCGRMLTFDIYECLWGLFRTSLLFLALLGSLAAHAGGSPGWRSVVRVTFLGALAMSLTAGVGALFVEH